jgi:hypothetical protein
MGRRGLPPGLYPAEIQRAAPGVFQAIIGSAMRLRNSVAIEVVLIVFMFGHYLWSAPIFPLVEKGLLKSLFSKDSP